MDFKGVGGKMRGKWPTCPCGPRAGVPRYCLYQAFLSSHSSHAYRKKSSADSNANEAKHILIITTASWRRAIPWTRKIVNPRKQQQIPNKFQCIFLCSARDELSEIDQTYNSQYKISCKVFSTIYLFYDQDPPKTKK